MAMKDYIKDLTTNVISTGLFDKIKITATKTDITVESVDKDKIAILKGKFSDPLTDLEGEFGLSNLSLLQTITSDPEFSSDDSIMSVVYDTKNSEKNPMELTYQNKSKSHITYRFMSKLLIPEQPKFNEPKWDLVVKPSKANTQQFSWVANGLSTYEQYFTPKVIKNELRFFIGEETAASQRGGIVFATDVKDQFDCGYKWKIQQLQTVLKIGDNCDCEMSLSTKGAIQITLNTGIGIYKYIFPAKIK